MLRHFNKFSFAHASMTIKVDNKVIDSLNIIYFHEYHILLFIYLFSQSFWYYYLLTCEAGNLCSFTSSIVVRVELFESACSTKITG